MKISANNFEHVFTTMSKKEQIAAPAADAIVVPMELQMCHFNAREELLIQVAGMETI